MSKYQVRFGSGKVLSSHDSLGEAGRAANAHNRANPHFTMLVSVHHVAAPGTPFIGDVTGLAYQAGGVYGQKKGPKLPRRMQRRKHGPGDAVDELIRSIQKRAKKSRHFRY